MFRRGCNHRLRQTLVDFADGSRQAKPWAQDIYARGPELTDTTTPTRDSGTDADVRVKRP